ncbi:MAG: LCP family protein [Oscillospiraceae bacterium]|jgi:LCP family protein required for cell wall assembly
MPKNKGQFEDISSGRQKKKMPLKKKLLIALCIVVIIVCTLVITAMILLNSKLFQGGEGDISSEIQTEEEIKEDVVSFLICGIDDEEGRGLGERTDLIMYVTFDIKAGKVDILQIPRDTYVENTSTNKINAVYGRKENGGVQGLASEINRLFKLPVDHYATIKMDGFKDLVDAIGGVTMDVPYDYDWGGGLTVKKGLQTLDGAHAEVIVRHRGAAGSSTGNYALGDISRLQIQRLFIAAMMEQLLELSKTELLGLVPTLLNYVSTDLTPNQMMGFLGVVNGLSMDHVVMHLLPGEGIPPAYALYSVHLQATADLLNESFRPYSAEVAAEELECVEMYNQTTYLDGNQGVLGEIVGGDSGQSSSSQSSSNSSASDSAA